MKLRNTLATALLGLALTGIPASAAINPNQLGASYDATKSNVTFKVYSSRATRIELYLYNTATGTAEKAKYVMSLGTGGIWSVSIPVATLSSQGITGTIYYGYRAWGPNWPYSASWTKGSGTGFISDVDANGNRFNPNKLLTDPYALELSHDPTTATMSTLRVRQDGRRSDARVQGNGEGLPRPGHQGVHRRRLQPHGRRRPVVADRQDHLQHLRHAWPG